MNELITNLSSKNMETASFGFNNGAGRYRYYYKGGIPVVVQHPFSNEQMMWKMFFVNWWYDRIFDAMATKVPTIIEQKTGKKVTSEQVRANASLDHVQFQKNGEIILGWNTEKDTFVGTEYSALCLIGKITKAGDGYSYCIALDTFKK